MELEIENTKSVKPVKAGDILVFNGDPYFVIQHRFPKIMGNGTKYDLVDFDGTCYWTGQLTYDELKDYTLKAEAHYSQTEFKLKMISH